MHPVLEVCVDSTASALAAKRGGADRLELCADLIVGGTTPSLPLLRQIKAETGLPVRALLRPRFGDFCYDHWELAQMEQSAAELVEAGADGIVTGVLTPEGGLDVDALRPIYAAARRAAEKAGRPVDCTLHRAFDVCRDPFAALEAAKALGLATILRRTIEEVEGISLTACDDSEGRTYLMYQPRYPWQITEKERNLTEERLTELFQRYFGMLTDEIIDIEYQSAENGG